MDRFKDGPIRSLNMPAFHPPLYADLVHDFGALEFLLDTENPNLLVELSVEQEGFHQVLESLRIRKEFYVREVQPLISSKELNGKRISFDELAAALGDRVFGEAMNGAQVVSELFAASSTGIPKVHKSLFLVAKELYPEHKFIEGIQDEAQARTNRCRGRRA